MDVVNGWLILAHPLLIEQIGKLVAAGEKARQRNPQTFGQDANVKLLVALRHLIWEKIPADPAAAEYRQGNTLGEGRKHWFRAKFGNQRFRLFFRYSSAARTIIFAWVNDEKTLRTYGARTDAYAVFRRMLADGHPPDDWDALMRAAIPARAALESLPEQDG